MWETFQIPPDRVTQDLLDAASFQDPPHAVSPVCVCLSSLLPVSGGREHELGDKSSSNTSVEDGKSPEVMMIPDKLNQ